MTEKKLDVRDIATLENITDKIYQQMNVYDLLPCVNNINEMRNCKLEIYSLAKKYLFSLKSYCDPIYSAKTGSFIYEKQFIYNIIIDFFDNHKEIQRIPLGELLNILNHEFGLQKIELKPYMPKEPIKKIDKILEERSNDYGSFTDNAEFTQKIIGMLEEHKNYKELTSVHKEALHMIIHKISRIINGNPNKLDSWLDIAGYATLTGNTLKGD